jgi:1-acyl-sn-glycerol-3-phosphate acyltransferase
MRKGPATRFDFDNAHRPRAYTFFYNRFYHLFEHLGGINVVDTDKAAAPGKKVVTSNHETLVDPFAMGIANEQEALFSLGKDQLASWRYAFIGKWALGPLMNTQFIKRTGQDYDILQGVAEFMMENDAAVQSYLYGTRRADEKGVAAKPGIAHIAIKSSTEDSPTPIQPYGISTSVWKPGRPIQVVTGEPVYAPENGIELTGGALSKERKRITKELADQIVDLKKRAIELDKDGAGEVGKIVFNR